MLRVYCDKINICTGNVNTSQVMDCQLERLQDPLFADAITQLIEFHCIKLLRYVVLSCAL